MGAHRDGHQQDERQEAAGISTGTFSSGRGRDTSSPTRARMWSVMASILNVPSVFLGHILELRWPEP